MTLIERLEAAEVGSRELDADVASVLEDGEVVWVQNRYIEGSNPAIRRPSADHVGGFVNEPCHAYTTSLDAALALAERVLPEARASINTGSGWVRLVTLDGQYDYGFFGVAKAPTPALALCIAILKAKEASDA